MDADKPKGQPDSVRVLTKAMAVLELLAESEGPVPLNEISARLGLNKSTCHRILNTLVGGTFVERAAPGSYRLGIGVFRVGSAMARHLDVRERSLPAMEGLHRTTGETVFLCVPRDGEAVCVERLDGRYASTHFLRLGGALPLHIGAAPRVLLAALPDAEVDAYLARPLERNTPDTPATATELWPEITRIRAAGRAVSRDDVVPGVKAFGAPVRDHTGRVVAALSLSGMAAHIADEAETDVLDAVAAAADEASAAMGHRPAPDPHPLPRSPPSLPTHTDTRSRRFARGGPAWAAARCACAGGGGFGVT
ncbi:IclR family transcriptional regulator [Actinomadura sp. J1-007]|uniref:IclR family transcriptional regulator n=1 Tax=Actinomadura sp. J1-007 TaxID=2661913 RepID=UPI001371CD45|nr:IclR family transcriptional regulator [Actinomadura sp. J1-007]